MEWNTKWDWENIDIYNLKGVTSPKKLQSAYWGIGEGEEIDGSFNLSRVVGDSGGSSTKSSISASAESSFKEGMSMKRPDFSFERFGCFSDSYSKKKELDSPLEASVCSGEPFIGLKLGKRTYFENGYAKSRNKTSSLLGVPVASVSAGKKVKSSCQSTPISRCQVEGCNLDLSSAKEYHRKHRVCESHSKCPKVIVAGHERRFCQQCSRFHSMSEFDDEKRSCRRRLSDHNARRRKPQQESIRFNSMSHCSSFYGVQLSDALNMPAFALNRLVPSKGARVEIFDQGIKESSSNGDAVDVGRALSLLSNNSWGSCVAFNDLPIHSSVATITMPIPQDLPLSSAEDYWQWQAAQQSIDPRIQPKTSNFHIFKSPYENPFLFHPNG